MTIALVTGANRGIGRAIAAQLAQRDMTVLVGARDPAQGIRAATEIATGGGTTEAVVLDVTNADTIAAAAAAIAERHGQLDVLINNAGVSGYPASLEPGAVDLDAVRRVLETNVLGVIAVTEAMLPLLRRSPAARVVNVSSSVGSLTHMSDPDHHFARMPAHVAYPVSKSALNMVTLQYAKALRTDGIVVNAADPGACATDFTEHLGLPIPRTAADGAAIAVTLATLDPDGPTGHLIAGDGPVPW